MTATGQITKLVNIEFANSALPKLSIQPAGVVTTLAGLAGSSGSTDGTGSAARFATPVALGITPNLAEAYVGDNASHLIRKVVLATGAVTTVAGSGSDANADGIGVLAAFRGPSDMAVSSDGATVYVADVAGHVIRTIATSNFDCQTLAGSGAAGSADGTGVAATFSSPWGVAISPDGGSLYVADFGNNLIRKIVISTGVVTTVASTGTSTGPTGIAIDSNGVYAYIACFSNHVIKRLNLSTVELTTIAGTAGTGATTNGWGLAAAFNGPIKCRLEPSGRYLWVVDRTGNTIRKLDLLTSQVTTFAGSGSAAETDGTGTGAAFNSPRNLVLDYMKGLYYTVDSAGHTLRKIV